jgi:hypothetical protein
MAGAITGFSVIVTSNIKEKNTKKHRFLVTAIYTSGNGRVLYRGF